MFNILHNNKLLKYYKTNVQNKTHKPNKLQIMH